MNKSRNIILISLFPILLTLLFISYVVYPVFQQMSEASEAYKSEKTALQDDQKKITELKENRTLFNQVQELNNKLADFDIRIPSENNLEIMLIDFEKYALAYKVKLVSLSSKTEKAVSLQNDNQKSDKKSKKKKRRPKKAEEEPIRLSGIPIQIQVVGYYTDVIKFIKTVENYRREVAISGINVTNYKDDADSPKPRVETTIDGNVYKFIVEEESTDGETTVSDKEDKS